jgi:ABC-type lipoprotein export system ATPase subunit
LQHTTLIENSTYDPLIALREVVKMYQTAAGDFPALNGLDLTVYPGEFVTIVGRSGAGKSTLINMITGIDHPTSGEVIIGGVSIHQLGEDSLSRWRGNNLGVVFQFFQLLPNINLIENITIAMDFCSTYPLKERKARALELLDQVGIAEHAYKVPSRISGGQQQRAAIARALANDPLILVADEPTGNLDERTADEVFGLFESLAAQGRTLMVVTHDEDIAARGSRSVTLLDGQSVHGAEPVGQGV